MKSCAIVYGIKSVLIAAGEGEGGIGGGDLDMVIPLAGVNGLEVLSLSIVSKAVLIAGESCSGHVKSCVIVRGRQAGGTSTWSLLWLV